MLACIHKARRYCRTFFNFFVGRLPNSSDMMMTLMFAANRTTTEEEEEEEEEGEETLFVNGIVTVGAV